MDRTDGISWSQLSPHFLVFQEEVLQAVGEQGLQLGLLFGTESRFIQEKQPDVLSFGHKSLQQFVAKYFIDHNVRNLLNLF